MSTRASNTRLADTLDRGGQPGSRAPTVPRTAGVFCMLPWTSLHVATNGDALPCCIGAADQPVGSLRTQSIPEIWNGAALRELRLRMLEGLPSRTCAKCYDEERHGFVSLRNLADAEFGHHAPFVHETAPDGSLPRMNLAYLDIRFSNVCNFSCRTCGPSYSTAWYRYAARESPRGLIRPMGSTAALLQQVQPLLASVEQIYFAGGEPALIREHYDILETLIAIGRTDVRLSYSTNFSTFRFGRWNLLELWQRFPDVAVGASLDGSGARGEYLRAGQRWADVVAMRSRQLEACPHVSFTVGSTLSNLNCLHLPDFHEEWIDAGLIEPWQVSINILERPAYFRLTSLPAALKDRVRARYDAHIRTLAAASTSRRAADAYAAAVRLMDSEDTTRALPELRRVLREQDRLRGESFTATFPELRTLLESEAPLAAAPRGDPHSG